MRRQCSWSTNLPEALAEIALPAFVLNTRGDIRWLNAAALEGAAQAMRLTPRQLEVLKLLAGGCSTDRIADRLQLSKETVRNHIRNVLRRLGAHSRLEAVARARALGII
jgi:DNA-binding CsgD family transcriptional regulator